MLSHIKNQSCVMDAFTNLQYTCKNTQNRSNYLSAIQIISRHVALQLIAQPLHRTFRQKLAKHFHKNYQTANKKISKKQHTSDSKAKKLKGPETSFFLNADSNIKRSNVPDDGHNYRGLFFAENTHNTLTWFNLLTFDICLEGSYTNEETR